MNTKEATKPPVGEMTISEIKLHKRSLRSVAVDVVELTRHLCMCALVERLRLPVTIDLGDCTVEIKEGVEPNEPHVSLMLKKRRFEQPVTDGDGVIPFSGSDEG
jgi:hypothetical protein